MNARQRLIKKVAFITGLVSAVRGRVAKKEGKDFAGTAMMNTVGGGAVGVGHALLAGLILDKLGLPLSGDSVAKIALLLGAEGAVEGLAGTGLGYSFTSGPPQNQNKTDAQIIIDSLSKK